MVGAGASGWLVLLPFTGTVEEWGVTRWRESLRWFLFLALLKMARSAMFPERPEQSQVCCSWSTCTLEIELPRVTAGKQSCSKEASGVVKFYHLGEVGMDVGMPSQYSY